jgi:hypothetical protein
MRLSVNLDAALTVVANWCYRWLGSQLRDYASAAPKQLYRRFVETAGWVEIQPEVIRIRFDRRSHNPMIREANLDSESQPIPWIGNRRVAFAFA